MNFPQLANLPSKASPTKRKESYSHRRVEGEHMPGFVLLKKGKEIGLLPLVAYFAIKVFRLPSDQLRARFCQMIITFNLKYSIAQWVPVRYPLHGLNQAVHPLSSISREKTDICMSESLNSLLS